MAEAIRAAFGKEDVEISAEAELGFMVLADAIQCLQHLRDAYTAEK